MLSATRIAQWGLILVGLSACQDMQNPGDPFSPVPVSASGETTRAAPVPLGGPQGDFDFEGEDRPQSELPGIDGDATDAELLALQARANGLDPSDLTAPAPGPAMVAPVAPLAPVVVPEWDPTQPLPSGSWGVRLLATLHDVQPPRAVLGLPGGEEIVVQPGSFIEAHRLVVIAVGRDVIQLSKVTPQGFYAKVETQTIQSLFPPAAAN